MCTGDAWALVVLREPVVVGVVACAVTLAVVRSEAGTVMEPVGMTMELLAGRMPEDAAPVPVGYGARVEAAFVVLFVAEAEPLVDADAEAEVQEPQESEDEDDEELGL